MTLQYESENITCPAHRWVQNVELACSGVLGAVFASAVGSASDCRSRGREFEPNVGHITFVEIDYELISRSDSNRTDSNFQTKVSTNQTTEGTEMRWCFLGGTSFWTDYTIQRVFHIHASYCTIPMPVSNLASTKMSNLWNVKYEIILQHFGPERASLCLYLLVSHASLGTFFTRFFVLEISDVLVVLFV